MSDRHLFNTNLQDLVVRSLRGLVASHPHLSLLPSLKVVYDGAHDRRRVALLCGGGSGHEPGTVGFVGAGLLSASVAGDVFASPSARQVLGAIRAVPSDKGTILIITNYTGDNLHFGLARLMAHGQGIENVELVVVGDDVSVPRSRGKMVGRRCLAGITLVCKILGAGAQADMGFAELVDLGRAVADNTASVCVALDHCHVPGRSGEFSQIAPGRVEIGLGLHNETGVFNVATPSAEDLFKHVLDLILDQDDPERAFVRFNDGDELVLLVNNQGGLSALEMGAAVDEVLTQLERRGIVPVRIFNGPFMGSLNMPGLSVSLLNLTNVASLTAVSTARLVELIDAPHTSFAWPATQGVYPLPPPVAGRTRADAYAEEAEAKAAAPPYAGPKLNVAPHSLREAMRAAAHDVLALEPDLTRWDTIVGDGDCGETCAMGANAVLAALGQGLGTPGELVGLFRELTEIIDEACGGTLGAIFSIFLAGLTTSLMDLAAGAPVPSTIEPAFVGRAALSALEVLKQRTAARVGHRTVMDALIPFAETLAATGDVAGAAAACRVGGEGTAHLTAKLGRAAYVGDARADMPPDPGAMAFVAVVEGIVKVYGKQ
ncbi:hypothetical protein Q5752_002131 [Cryptotrichosporon argae]